mgnify:CR=1 FL=1
MSARAEPHAGGDGSVAPDATLGAYGQRGTAELALALGLARRAALLIHTLADVDRPDWRRVQATATACLQRLDALACQTGVAPERRDLCSLMRAQLYRADDTLQEARPERLKAFGSLSREQQTDLADDLAPLWELLAALRVTLDRLPALEL